jgi:hypothetical protein
LLSNGKLRTGNILFVCFFNLRHLSALEAFEALRIMGKFEGKAGEGEKWKGNVGK